MKTDKQQSDKKLSFLRSEFAVGWTVWKISLCPGIEISLFAEEGTKFMEWYNKMSPESKLTMKVYKVCFVYFKSPFVTNSR